MPLLENATIINIGIDQANILFCSINIFFTAGSSNQAIAEVLPATTIERTRATNILFICFLTYSLNNFFKSVFSSSNFILQIY